MGQELKAKTGGAGMGGAWPVIDMASRRPLPDRARQDGPGAALSGEESQRLLQIITQALRVRRHYELFQLLQNEVQYFIPHQLLISAWGDFGGPDLKIDVISAIPDVRTGKVGNCGLDQLLQGQYVRWIANGRKPLLLAAGDADWPAPFGSCPCPLHRALASMQSLLVHGVSDLRDNADSLYMLASSGQILRAGTGDEGFRSVLETIIGQVDSAYRRVGSLKPRSKAMPHKILGDERNLSAREIEVLSGVAQGLGNSDIARKLSISPHTVKNHMKRIMRKLRVTNRTAAAAHYRG